MFQQTLNAPDARAASFVQRGVPDPAPAALAGISAAIEGIGTVMQVKDAQAQAGVRGEAESIMESFAQGSFQMTDEELSSMVALEKSASVLSQQLPEHVLNVRLEKLYKDAAGRYPHLADEMRQAVSKGSGRDVVGASVRLKMAQEELIGQELAQEQAIVDSYLKNIADSTIKQQMAFEVRQMTQSGMNSAQITKALDERYHQYFQQGANAALLETRLKNIQANTNLTTQQQQSQSAAAMVEFASSNPPSFVVDSTLTRLNGGVRMTTSELLTLPDDQKAAMFDQMKQTLVDQKSQFMISTYGANERTVALRDSYFQLVDEQVNLLEKAITGDTVAQKALENRLKARENLSKMNALDTVDKLTQVNHPLGQLLNIAKTVNGFNLDPATAKAITAELLAMDIAMDGGDLDAAAEAKANSASKGFSVMKNVPTGELLSNSETFVRSATSTVNTILKPEVLKDAVPLNKLQEISEGLRNATPAQVREVFEGVDSRLADKFEADLGKAIGAKTLSQVLTPVSNMAGSSELQALRQQKQRQGLLPAAPIDISGQREARLAAESQGRLTVVNGRLRLINEQGNDVTATATNTRETRAQWETATKAFDVIYKDMLPMSMKLQGIEPTAERLDKELNTLFGALSGTQESASPFDQAAEDRDVLGSISAFVKPPVQDMSRRPQSVSQVQEDEPGLTIEISGGTTEGLNYGRLIAQDEGYRPGLSSLDGRGSISMNVPSERSGITIAGVDLADFDGGSERALDVLSNFLEPEVINSLREGANLRGQAARDFIRDNKIQINLSEQDIQNIASEAGRPYEQRVISALGESNFRNLDPKIAEPLVSLSFLNTGSRSLALLKTALETNTLEDWKKVENAYRNYWSDPTPHNRKRSDRVAYAVASYIKTLKE
jgi:hypothetical protein